MRAKPYPRYKPSSVDWLGEVPVDWEVKPLKQATYFTDKKSEADEDNPRPYIGLEHIESWTGRLHPLDPELQPTGIANEFKAGNVLFGKLRPYLAKACYVDFGGLCSSELLVLNGRELGGRFLLYLLLTDGFVREVDSSTYGAKMPRASWQFVGNRSVPVPSADEQEAIADFLDCEMAKIDALIAKKRALMEQLKEKRAALISRTVTCGLPTDVASALGLDPDPKLKRSGIEWLGDIPVHWQVKRLKYVGEALIGLTYDPGDVVNEGEGTLVLRASNVSNGRLVLGDNVYVECAIPERLFTQVGDLLICARSGSRDLIGKNAKITEEFAGVAFGTFMLIFRSPWNDYLFHVFNSKLFDFQSGAFLTTTINQLTVSNLYSFEIPVPPHHERLAIARFLDLETAKLDCMVQKVKQAIVRLSEYRAALIAAAVTGKIDVRGLVKPATNEPRAALAQNI